jgi:hypothetical protein
MKLLLICGPWGSGTSGVAGLLARLGVEGFGPFFMCNDRTRPNTYELLPFRNAVRPFLIEQTLSLVPNSEQKINSILRSFRNRIENQEFGAYDTTSGLPVFLKYPLSALIIPQICNVFETKLIYVLRPLEDIEQTRLRRRWNPELGRKGAEVIYTAMFRALVETEDSTMILRYTELIRSPIKIARELVSFAELRATTAHIQAASAFIDPPKPSAARDSIRADSM